jgi:hypothetical protein
MNCPSCNKQGQKVPTETVRSSVKTNCEDKTSETGFYLCMNPDCRVAYYSSNSVFYKSDVKKPLWYKKGADPKYACYCRKITQEEVTTAVLENGLTQADDIMFHLRGNVKSNCKINNPTGHCCHPVFNKMIEKAIEAKVGAEKER